MPLEGEGGREAGAEKGGGGGGEKKWLFIRSAHTLSFSLVLRKRKNAGKRREGKARSVFFLVIFARGEKEKSQKRGRGGEKSHRHARNPLRVDSMSSTKLAERKTVGEKEGGGPAE